MSLSNLLQTRYPLIQAPMAGVQDSALAIAVSNAGALGSLPCAMLSPAQIRSELTALRAGTDKPYNVNFFCHTPPQPDVEKEMQWRDTLLPYYRELGVDPSSITAAAQRLPFSDEMADILEGFKPPVVSFHFGLPTPHLLQRVKAWGATVLSSATTLEEGLWLQAHGADAVIAQGLEAGGHRGIFLSDDLSTQVGTLALVPQLVARLRVPVIAAGGIADAAGVQAAMALGAAGVQVGTSYLLAHEARTSAVHRAALKGPEAVHTALTNVFTGRPARGIMNRVMREVGPLSAHAPAFPLAGGTLAPLRAQAEARQSGDFSPLWAGQNTSGCAELPAAEITSRLVQGLQARLLA